MADFDPIFDRANVYEDADGTVVYRASSFGYCIGALVRARMGMTPSPPPDLMLERYQEGHDWEREVLIAGLGVDYVTVEVDSELQRLGTIVEGRNGERQVEAELRWGGEAAQRCVRVHPDAIVRRGADRSLHVAEVKFLAKARVDEMTRAGDDMVTVLGVPYAWQASIEMLATGLPMLYIVGAKEVEVTKDERRVVGLGDVLTMRWDEPAFSLLDVKMRVAEVEGWAARGDFPPCPVPFDYPCGFWAEHEEREKAEIDDEQLAHLVESYGRAKDKEAAHKAEAERIRDDIADRLIDLHVDAGRIGGWDIAHTPSRDGNVSWKSAYEALAKLTKKSVEVDRYRGDKVAAGLKMTKVKEKGDG